MTVEKIFCDPQNIMLKLNIKNIPVASVDNPAGQISGVPLLDGQVGWHM